MKASILLQNDHVVVAYKPNNIDFDLFSTQLSAKLGEKKGADCKIIPSFDLDKDVSGVSLFTLDDKTQANLDTQIVDGEFEMDYYAVVVGAPIQKKGIYSACVKRDGQSGLLNHIPLLNEGAINFSFGYSVVEEVGKISLVKISGVILQQELIRFGLADMGCPVFGDKDYGGDTLAKDTFLALSLVDLRFENPENGDVLSFRAVPDTKPWTYFNLDKWFKI